MAAGRLMLDVQGTRLTQEEREQLKHPEVGGLVLFTRNYQSKQQLADLITDIRSQNPDILLAVDHEGGRVQRFREGFITLPPMAELADVWQRDREAAQVQAENLGWLMAAELVQLDIDISFAPVLDIDWCRSQIIGNRAFGTCAQQVTALAGAFMAGMHSAGMAATGKHFPGHGWAQADSHLALPVDERTLDQIRQTDLQPFMALTAAGMDAIMPAHILYSAVDTQPAGFSRIWLQDILRKELDFKGIIFSDDLSMVGAHQAGGYPARAQAALAAGCDCVLVCNNPAGAQQVLTALESLPATTLPLSRMRRKRAITIDTARFEALAQEISLRTHSGQEIS